MVARAFPPTTNGPICGRWSLSTGNQQAHSRSLKPFHRRSTEGLAVASACPVACENAAGPNPLAAKTALNAPEALALRDHNPVSEEFVVRSLIDVGVAIAVSFLVAAFATGCRSDSPRPEPARPVAETDEDALSRADAAAMALGGTLKKRLLAEMPNGPFAALTVCANEAQDIGARVAKEQNAKVGRASVRTRNERNVAPDWVREWLETNSARPAAAAKGFARVDEVRGKRLARVVKPIPVEPSCVVCHGTQEHLAPEVVAMLAERYPSDEAVGYEVGDLRGALWAEVPVNER